MDRRCPRSGWGGIGASIWPGLVAYTGAGGGGRISGRHRTVGAGGAPGSLGRGVLRPGHPDRLAAALGEQGGRASELVPSIGPLGFL